MKNELSRITIDVPAATHKRLKALAAHQGKSMRKMIMDLINLRLAAQNNEQECPYDHMPNAKTKKALDNIKKGKNLVHAKDAKDLLKKLGL